MGCGHKRQREGMRDEVWGGDVGRCTHLLAADRRSRGGALVGVDSSAAAVAEGTEEEAGVVAVKLDWRDGRRLGESAIVDGIPKKGALTSAASPSSMPQGTVTLRAALAALMAPGVPSVPSEPAPNVGLASCTRLHVGVGVTRFFCFTRPLLACCDSAGGPAPPSGGKSSAPLTVELAAPLSAADDGEIFALFSLLTGAAGGGALAPVAARVAASAATPASSQRTSSLETHVESSRANASAACGSASSCAAASAAEQRLYHSRLTVGGDIGREREDALARCATACCLLCQFVCLPLPDRCPLSVRPRQAAMELCTPSDAEGECAICLTGLSSLETELHTTHCRHQFCKFCLGSYAMKRPIDGRNVPCPICRAPLPAEDLPSTFSVSIAREPSTRLGIEVSSSQAFLSSGESSSQDDEICVRITSVVAGSVAAAAGLRAGLRLLAVNDVQLTRASQLAECLQAADSHHIKLRLGDLRYVPPAAAPSATTTTAEAATAASLDYQIVTHEHCGYACFCCCNVVGQVWARANHLPGRYCRLVAAILWCLVIIAVCSRGGSNPRRLPVAPPLKDRRGRLVC